MFDVCCVTRGILLTTKNVKMVREHKSQYLHPPLRLGQSIQPLRFPSRRFDGHVFLIWVILLLVSPSKFCGSFNMLVPRVG